MVYQCRFCTRFVKASESMKDPIFSGVNGKTIIDRRYCIIKGGLVTPEDGCEKLILSSTFWCRTRHQWMYKEACIKRYIDKKEDECKRCSDGKELVALIRRVGTKQRKRKLLIRKQNDQNTDK